MINLKSTDIFKIKTGDVATVPYFEEWNSVKGTTIFIDGVSVFVIDVERHPQRQPSFGRELTKEEWEKRDVALLCRAFDVPV